VCRSSGDKEPTVAVDFGIVLLACVLHIEQHDPASEFGQHKIFFSFEQRFICPVLISILILFEVLLFTGQISSCSD
jgi:hypothetical protein